MYFNINLKINTFVCSYCIYDILLYLNNYKGIYK